MWRHMVGWGVAWWGVAWCGVVWVGGQVDVTLDGCPLSQENELAVLSGRGMNVREEGVGRREATVKAHESWTAEREVPSLGIQPRVGCPESSCPLEQI